MRQAELPHCAPPGRVHTGQGAGQAPRVDQAGLGMGSGTKGDGRLPEKQFFEAGGQLGVDFQPELHSHCIVLFSSSSVAARRALCQS